MQICYSYISIVITWQVDDGYKIELTFTDFDLEDEANCEYDYVEGNRWTFVFKITVLFIPPYIIDTYLTDLRRGTLSQCRSPAGEAFKKKKNTSPRWGVGGVILVWCKNVFCYMSQICHISCNVFHEFCKKWQHFLINQFIFKNKQQIIS